LHKVKGYWTVRNVSSPAVSWLTQSYCTLKDHQEPIIISIIRFNTILAKTLLIMKLSNIVLTILSIDSYQKLPPMLSSTISRDTEFHGLLEYITFVSLSDFFNYNYTRKLGGKTTGKSTQKNLTVKSPLKHKRSS